MNLTYGTCLYCGENKHVKTWKETGEEVCYDCRLSQLDQEYEVLFMEATD